jgi:diaminohydroxyphosphoribosylaminopyrimidine deaminase/5-amino-6-(5-phosphoribosylamino)uracil reductase
LQAAIRRVIVATIDPATHARGLGIAELRAGGVEVDVGLCAVEAQKLIAPFQKLLVTGRPWVHAKWAMTLDGKIASTSGKSQWISNEASRQVVHRLRGRMDAILVGLGTVIADDPLLTVRPPGQRVPTRIVLDSTAQTPLKSQLGCTARSVPTMLVVTRSAPRQRCVALAATGAEILVISEDSNGHPDLRVLLAELGRRRMTNVLVEGGGQVLGGCFDQAVVDEVHAFIAPKVIGGSTAPSPVAGIGWPEMSDAISLEELSVEMLRGDLYLRGRIARNVERTGS